MLKICPDCHRTFSGGRFCLQCTGTALLDIADAGTRPHLKIADLQHTINTYYGARSAMLILFASLLSGLALALWVARPGFLAPAAERSLWMVGSVLTLLGIPALGLAAGALVVRLFGVCRGRPQSLEDLRASLRSRPG